MTEAIGITSRRWTLAAAAADLLGTGYPDLFLANDYGVSELFANQGGKRFVDMAADGRRRPHAEERHEASFGDIFNHGRLGHLHDQHLRAGRPAAGQQSLGAGAARGGRRDQRAFENLATGLGVDLGGWSWGAQFGDLNNDGTQDLYLTNGYVSAGDAAATGTTTRSSLSAQHDHRRRRQLARDARPQPLRATSKRVWLNDGLGKFTDVAQAIGVTDTFDGRAVVLADLCNRGALDVVVANQHGPLLCIEHRRADTHWIEFELAGAPSNRSAIGAQVELYWDGQVQLQDVVAGSGFSAQNQRRLHFGLGAAAQVERP